MNRVNIFAIHGCINEGYGLIRIFSEKIRISPTKLWRVWYNNIAKRLDIQEARFIVSDGGPKLLWVSLRKGQVNV